MFRKLQRNCHHQESHACEDPDNDNNTIESHETVNSPIRAHCGFGEKARKMRKCMRVYAYKGQYLIGFVIFWHYFPGFYYLLSGRKIHKQI